MTSQWFGDYEIVRRLRVGGMAKLYLARRHGAAGFARLVALKMIHPHLAEQPHFIEMFVDEARICSRISHPNVVHVEEFGEIDGIHYLVMEYLDGCSISELLVQYHHEHRTLDPELAARLIMQVASGLHAAHETRDDDGQPLDIIHRDISPSNVLLSSDGNAKLIDFGIAKARNRLSETEAGVTLKGKCKYVAPEQATRSAVDRRCDIFSLGIVFWELLVGQPLFPDDTHIALVNRLARTDVAPPSTLNPAVPATFDAIVLAMLQHDPADRPQTAAELQRRIASAVPGAANRDPSELGAIAVEVRDKHATRRAATGPAGPDTHESFSPTPRSLRSAPTGHRVEAEATPASGVSAPVVAQPTLPARWRGRRVQLGVAALLVASAAVGIFVGEHGGRSEASANAAREHRQVEVDVPSPPPPAMPPPSTIVASPPPPVPPPPPPAEPAAPAIAAATSAVPARGPVPSPPQPARRDPGRASSTLRPSRRARSEIEAKPVPAAPAPGPPSARPPFSTVPFDDAGNQRAAPVKPTPVNVKKMPIVPEFDH
ncbi:MAG TPA: serine/threonine-protein kinase [Kofleriaceae bacterium]|jgi:serine/threonine-protein kinase|nr:serine/threonine-protein kinase [Kofleriaceae bacterium]